MLNSVFARHPELLQANGTFTEMDEWVELLSSFSHASESLRSVSQQDAEKLEAALKNPVLGAALKETLQLDSTDLSDMLRRPNATSWLHSVNEMHPVPES